MGHLDSFSDKKARPIVAYREEVLWNLTTGAVRDSIWRASIAVRDTIAVYMQSYNVLCRQQLVLEEFIKDDNTTT